VIKDGDMVLMDAGV
jgi:Xaa-Pro dipeptidase